MAAQYSVSSGLELNINISQDPETAQSPDSSYKMFDAINDQNECTSYETKFLKSNDDFHRDNPLLIQIIKIVLQSFEKLNLTFVSEAR